jgi:hypothetical protein
MQWRRRKPRPAAASRSRHPDEGVELITVAFLVFTLEPNLSVSDVSFMPGEVTVDAAAELANEWLGGPYVSVQSASWYHSWLAGGMAMMSYQVGVEALILEEAYEAMDELERMAQDGRWKPGVSERFRLQRGERLPMIE